MIIIAIIGGIGIGWIVGMYIIDRYINENHKDIDNDYSLRSQSKGETPKTKPK